MGRPLIDITGRKFARLTAILHKYKTPYWKCLCDCGNTVSVTGHKLISSHTQSCGCLLTDILVKRNSTHRLSRRPEYVIWKGMKSRCLNKNNPAFKNYGGRGIKICVQWKNSFSEFFKAIGKRSHPYLSIDRINNDGHYEPGNVRWATRTQQANNKREYTHRNQWSK